MALVTFRSRAASAILMFEDSANHLLELIGRSPAERGVITPAQLDEALQRLEAAVELEKAGGSTSDDDDQPAMARRVTLRQRAFPLIEMLRAARKRAVDVTWGI